jgi:hypothetical protein
MNSDYDLKFAYSITKLLGWLATLEIRQITEN